MIRHVTRLHTHYTFSSVFFEFCFSCASGALRFVSGAAHTTPSDRFWSLLPCALLAGLCVLIFIRAQTVDAYMSKSPFTSARVRERE